MTQPVRRPMPAQAGTTLVCFHHAGGSAASFNAWRRQLPDGIRLVAAQLPGRSGEPAPAQPDLDALVALLWRDLRPVLVGARYALYGHSLGALVAYETARLALASGGPAPHRLLVSGRRAPHLPLRRPALCDQPDPAMLEAIRAFGGTPDRLLADPRWRRHSLPVLRADLALSDRYRWRESPALAMPIVAFRGRQDAIVDEDELAGWGDHAADEFTLHTLPGGHFFDAAGTRQLVALIAAELAGGPGRTAGPARNTAAALAG